MRSITLFVLIIALCNAEHAVTGSWVATIYKIRERVGFLESKLEEAEDIERQLLSKLDQANYDYDKALKAEEKAQIQETQKWLKGKVQLARNNKSMILKKMKTIVNGLPKEEKMELIRTLKIERRFNDLI